jgi:hypothetical protein
VNKALTQIHGGEIEGIFAAWLGKLGRPSGLLAAMRLFSILVSEASTNQRPRAVCRPTTRRRD